MAFSPPVVGCFFQKGVQKGGHGHPRTPPGYALVKPQINHFHKTNELISSRQTSSFSQDKRPHFRWDNDFSSKHSFNTIFPSDVFSFVFLYHFLFVEHVNEKMHTTEMACLRHPSCLSTCTFSLWRVNLIPNMTKRVWEWGCDLIISLAAHLPYFCSADSVNPQSTTIFFNFYKHAALKLWFLLMVIALILAFLIGVFSVLLLEGFFLYKWWTSMPEDDRKLYPKRTKVTNPKVNRRCNLRFFSFVYIIFW